MNILMFTSRYGFGYGMGYSAYKEAVALSDLGNSVTVVHCFSSPEIGLFVDRRIKTVYLPIIRVPIIGFFEYYLKLRSFLKDSDNFHGFDVVYIQSLEFGLLNFKKIKIPIFYFSRSTMVGLQKIVTGEGIKKSFLDKVIQRILIRLEKRCMRYTKLIFVKSSIMAKEVENLYKINSQKIATITGGIDKEDFHVCDGAISKDLKERLHIPPKTKIILYTGRIVPQKGLIYLINATLDLLKKYNFIVIIAGANFDDQYKHKIDEILNGNIHKKSFLFVGHINQKEIASYFSIADCVVTPSLYEPFGMVNLQAAFLGKSVVTTDVTGSIDILKDYPGLIVIPFGSITAIRTSLEKILSGQGNMDLQSFDFAQYSWAVVGKKLLNYFEK